MKKHSFTLCIVGLLTSSDSNRSSFYFITKLRKHRQNHKLFHCIAELIYRFFTNWEITTLRLHAILAKKDRRLCTYNPRNSGRGYPQSLIRDHEGKIQHVHCMTRKKRAQLAPNHPAAILEPNIRHHDLVLSTFWSRHFRCHLQLIGAHGKTIYPNQSFACLQERAIADALASLSATKIPVKTLCNYQNPSHNIC
jgi:hypothetical protein